MFGITIDENGFNELKKLYEEAVQKKQKTFIFQGQILGFCFLNICCKHNVKKDLDSIGSNPYLCGNKSKKISHEKDFLQLRNILFWTG